MLLFSARLRLPARRRRRRSASAVCSLSTNFRIPPLSEKRKTLESPPTTRKRHSSLPSVRPQFFGDTVTSPQLMSPTQRKKSRLLSRSESTTSLESMIKDRRQVYLNEKRHSLPSRLNNPAGVMMPVFPQTVQLEQTTALDATRAADISPPSSVASYPPMSPRKYNNHSPLSSRPSSGNTSPKRGTSKILFRRPQSNSVRNNNQRRNSA